MARITRFDERLKYLLALLAEAVQKRHDLCLHAYMDPAIAKIVDAEIEMLLGEIWNMSRPSTE